MVKAIASELTATQKLHQNYVAFTLGEQMIFNLQFPFVDATSVRCDCVFEKLSF